MTMSYIGLKFSAMFFNQNIKNNNYLPCGQNTSLHAVFQLWNNWGLPLLALILLRKLLDLNNNFSVDFKIKKNLNGFIFSNKLFWSTPVSCREEKWFWRSVSIIKFTFDYLEIHEHCKASNLRPRASKLKVLGSSYKQ